MCIFSANIRDVSRTQIFARLSNGQQYLVYEMNLSSAADVAMILPLPVDHTQGATVSFIDLSIYPAFFSDLNSCFELRYRAVAAAAMSAPTLAVVQVGSFEASVVPSLADFSRLDERFRLPPTIWDALPEYHDYAFAVFKLRAGKSHIHPMALQFASRFRDKIFFPTLHIHAGIVEAQADFDHQLFAQGLDNPPENWQKALLPVATEMDFENLLQAEAQRDILHREQTLFRATVRGKLANRDIFVATESR